MSYNTKNYTEQGGEVTHIGGKLIIDEGGSVEGLPSFPIAENQEDSHKRWCLAKCGLPLDICFAANGKLCIIGRKHYRVCRGRFVHVCFAENQLV